ncbi:putative beta-glucosidase btgE [Penicillium digitatum PHI26]|uniref:Probable beta-glucosidase btgE n=1 Tax=Penicillium digitatum (strain PHI26 / CECT 20796) TaxID=1170229 RepID=K9FNY0_PEND2|nr:putative beta-glucosidase btgE [Penicillium digitatum PHI26]
MKGAIFAAALVGSAMADGVHRRHDAFHQRREASASTWSSAGLNTEENCGCTTKVITIYGSPTLVPVESVAPTPSTSTSTSTSISTSTPVSTSSSTSTSVPVPVPVVDSTSTLTSTVHSTSTSTLTVTVSEPHPSVPAAKSPVVANTPAVELPTPGVSTYSATGVYTVPATTLTVHDTTTVCGATSTEVPSGTHTYGGVTTIVETSTTVVCPYATVKPHGSTVTSVIETTTYICPSAGTYTVVPPTTTTVPSSTVLVYPTPQTIVPGTYTRDETTVTVTRTDYTYICPVATRSLASAASAVPTTVAAATTAAPVAAATTAAPVAAAPTVAPVAGSVNSASAASVASVASVASAASAASASSASSASYFAASSSSSSSSSSSFAASSSSSISSTSGKPNSFPEALGQGKYGMTYSPYTAGGDCKTKQAVLQDLTVIKSKGFNLIRVYSTDCSGLEFIGDACKQLGLSIIMGVYIDGSGISAAQEQVTAISKWAEWGMVELIVVGNEAVQSGFIDAATLASFIQSASASFKAAGYTGLVTTTEPIDIWQAHGAAYLCGAVDIVGANIHPFFNADVVAAKAGEFAKSEFEELEQICNGKDVVNLETGWPNAGNPNGAAVPGVSEQAIAIKSIVETVGSKSIFFSFSDDAWKKPGEFDVEQHWGCSGVF